MDRANPKKFSVGLVAIDNRLVHGKICAEFSARLFAFALKLLARPQAYDEKNCLGAVMFLPRVFPWHPPVLRFRLQAKFDPVVLRSNFRGRSGRTFEKHTIYAPILKGRTSAIHLLPLNFVGHVALFSNSRRHLMYIHHTQI